MIRFDDPSKCPKCGSENMTADHFQEEDEAWRNVWCEDCGHKWIEVYVFDHCEDYSDEE